MNRLKILRPFNDPGTGSVSDQEKLHRAKINTTGAKAHDAEAKPEGTIVERSEVELGVEKIEPWPEPVDGAELMRELVNGIKRFVMVSHEALVAIALWIMFAHTHDAYEISPRLHRWSPVLRCGKSITLSVLEELLPNPYLVSGDSVASLVRRIDTWKQSVLLDEADRYVRGNRDFQQLINSGYRRRSAWFGLCVPQGGWTPRKFSTWAPMVLASIGDLADTNEDRSIRVEMRRSPRGANLELASIDALAELRPVARKCARWAADHIEQLRLAKPEAPVALDARATDNWRPLFAIADAIGKGWSERSREAAEALSTRIARGEESMDVMLLRDIAEIFGEMGHPQWINSEELRLRLAQKEEQPWGEASRGRAITARRLAILLKPFGIEPGSNGVKRGYERADFKDAFSRYL